MNKTIVKETDFEKKWYHLIPGILFCLVIALPSWLLGKEFPLIGGPIFALVMGILLTLFFPNLVSNTIKNKFGNVLCLQNGVQYTSKKLLQYSIILLGFEMNFYSIIKVGSQSLIIMLFTLSFAFLTAFLVGKALKLSGNITTLIGVGTSICGGSAIAATAPIIKAKNEDVSQAISTIFLFNIIAVFIFPIFGRMMGMSDVSFGIWAGTAINDTSSVVAAGSAWSTEAGNNLALQTATIVKLTRTLMIIPIAFFLAFYLTRQKKITSDFKFTKVFPWFVVFFGIAALLNTFAGLPIAVTTFLTETGKFIIIMALGAIGLNTNIKNLITNGVKPLILGISCWFVVAIVSIIIQVILGI